MPRPLAPLYFAISCAALLASASQADSRGSMPRGGTFEDNAHVCLSVGLQASLSGLDDFTLRTDQANGSARALFTGNESFHLQSNGGVRVTVEAQDLTNGDSRLTPSYWFDGIGQVLTTAKDETHNDEHVLYAQTRLGQISSQKAGAYSGKVTLTVAPDFGDLGSCGSRSGSYPKASYWATMAFEDLYPSAGDADYNDLVVNFRIEESYNSSLQTESIEMEFVPVASGAGFDHSLMMSLDGQIDNTDNATAVTDAVFDGSAEVAATYTNLSSGTSYTRYFADNEDILIFSSSKDVLQGYSNVYPFQELSQALWSTRVNVSLNNPADNNAKNMTDGEFNYRPYLMVKNTGHEIDIAEINPANGMVDSNGYPFGIIVPADWSWPAERVNINEVYPYFEEYRQWLTGEVEMLSVEAEEWFNHPAADAGTRVIKLDTLDLQNAEI